MLKVTAISVDKDRVNEEDDEKVYSSEGVAGAHTLSPQVAFSARLDTSNNKPNQERTCWRIKLKCNVTL